MESTTYRFGLFARTPRTRSEWIEKARQAEGAGFDTLLVGDHKIFPLTPFQALLAAADATTRLRVGSYLISNDFYHPLTLAREAATLDILSDGRFEFGLGTGWSARDYGVTGVALDPPGVRLDRLEESLKIIESAFSGETFSFQGKYYHIEGFTLTGKPLQQPRPPLLLGGGGRRMLSLAARAADIVSFNTLSTPAGGLDFTSATEKATAEKVAWVRQAQGSRVNLELCSHFIYLKIANSRAEQAAALDELKQSWKIGEGLLADGEILASPQVLVGSEDAMREKIQHLREQYGFSYFVFWEPLDIAARVIQRLR